MFLQSLAKFLLLQPFQLVGIPLISFKNGDAFDGVLDTFANQIFSIEIPRGKINIPLQKISQIEFSHLKYSESKRESGDVLIEFNDGSRVTLKPSSWKDSILSGKSQNIGTISINMSKVRTLSFNIYDNPEI